MTRRLSPMQRVYMIGLRRGKRQARQALREVSNELDDLYSAVGNLARDLHRLAAGNMRQAEIRQRVALQLLGIVGQNADPSTP